MRSIKLMEYELIVKTEFLRRREIEEKTTQGSWSGYGFVWYVWGNVSRQRKKWKQTRTMREVG